MKSTRNGIIYWKFCISLADLTIKDEFSKKEFRDYHRPKQEIIKEEVVNDHQLELEQFTEEILGETFEEHFQRYDEMLKNNTLPPDWNAAEDDDY